MAKIRIYALAKELGLTNDEMLRELHRMDLVFESALSTLDDEVAAQLRGDRKKTRVKVTKVAEKKPKKRAKRKAKPKEAKKAAPKAARKKRKPAAKPKVEVEEEAASVAEAVDPAVATAKPAKARVRRVRRGVVPPEPAPVTEEQAAAEAEVLVPAAEEPAVLEIAAALEPVEAEPIAAPPDRAPAAAAIPAAEVIPAPEVTPAAEAAKAVMEAPSAAEAMLEPKLKLRKKEVAVRPLGALRRPVRRPAPPSTAPGVRRIKKIRKVITTGKLPPKTAEAKRQRRRQEPVAMVDTEVRITEGMTVKDLAEKLQRKSKDVLAKMLEMGYLATINQNLDAETASKVAEALGAVAEVVTFEEDLVLHEVEEEKDVEQLERPPVVVVMGHVDHGKTSILDAIRQTNVAARESGGITQHIGAYQVAPHGKTISFLDTPGHEAFTLMRLRGADATDIVVLVVAGDDGIMPQTLESINHARAANKPIIVAINKCDKPGADPERVMRQLGEQDLLPEDWGGQTITVKCSAHTGDGLEHLLEMILLQSELMELKAAPDRAAMGSVLEARLDKARGAVATILVQDGTLRTGDFLLAGSVLGKVRAMFDHSGDRLTAAPPSTPVEVLGLGGVPEAGDQFQVVPDETRARKMAEFRQEKQQRQKMGSSARMTLDQLYQKIQEGGAKELKIILKADVQGSVEVLKKSLRDLSTDSVRVTVLDAASGPISESDVLLASTSGAIVIGFNVRPERNARSLADEEGVDIRLHTVIYHVTEEVEKAMLGLLDPEEREVDLGKAEVRETFRIPRIGVVAGCHVSEGRIERGSLARLLRDNVVIYEGRLSSLRRFKEDVGEVRSGFECGIALENFQDIKPGDMIDAYRIDKVRIEVLT